MRGLLMLSLWSRSFNQIALHFLSTEPMDFFVALFPIAFNTADAEPAPSTPIDADGGGSGGTGGCIVA
jgi:hypothetical protein